MKLEGFEAILRSIKKTNIKEVEIKSRLTRLKIVRKDEEVHSNQTLNNTVSLPLEEIKKSKNKDICSRQIGFFNRYNPKTKKQFFKLRDEVKKGDIVGTIVSMHIHNDIMSEHDGKITEFLVEQDQPIEYGQPLIRLQ